LDTGICGSAKPEEKVRKYLFSKGFRYRKNDKRLHGKPDIVLAKYKTVIFVNGCFWHGHTDCKYFTWPKSNIVFWKNKITKNINRDKEVKEQLKNLGWTVITIWECKLKKECFKDTMYEVEQLILTNSNIH
jgi:DNA mismatch endonuclease (patch repair protein)